MKRTFENFIIWIAKQDIPETLRRHLAYYVIKFIEETEKEDSE